MSGEEELASLIQRLPSRENLKGFKMLPAEFEKASHHFIISLVGGWLVVCVWDTYFMHNNPPKKLTGGGRGGEGGARFLCRH